MSQYGPAGGTRCPGVQPGYYPPALPEHPQGTTVLVLGVLSLVVGLTAPFAWYYGSRAEREIRASGLQFSNTTQIQLGKILGIIGTVLMGVGLLFVGVYLVVVFVIMASVLSSAG